MFQVLLCHFDILLAVLQDHACCLSADIAQTAFQTTDTGLTGIVENDIFNGLIADRQLFRLNAVGFHLLLDQMLFGNMKLLILCIRMISIRSNSGRGMVDKLLAVAINSTSERSSGSSR